MTLGKMKQRYKTKKIYFLDYYNGEKRRRLILNNLKEIQEIGRKYIREGNFISLKNAKNVFLPC